MTEAEAGGVLSRLNHLSRWVQAQQAKVLARMQAVYEEESMLLTGVEDTDMAFSLAAEEAAAILGVPAGTGKALMSEAGDLCGAHAGTLAKLESGQIGYGHVQVLLEQSVGVLPEKLPAFEAELLGLAGGLTKAQFRVKARRLRENLYPETLIERQRTAYDRRTVWMQPEPDGMACLSAIMPAQTAQSIYTQLTAAARGEQAAGDTRTVNQLRTDIFADLLGGHGHESGGCSSGAVLGTPGGTGDSGGTGDPDEEERNEDGRHEHRKASGTCRIAHGPAARGRSPGRDQCRNALRGR